MSQWDTIKIIKDTMNVRQVAQDTADFIIMDLESEGYKARLRIKNEKRDFYFSRTRQQINDMKAALGLKRKPKVD